MAVDVVTVSIRYNRRRAMQILAEVRAKLRRARKRDRPAVFSRYYRRMLETCVRVVNT